MYVFTFATCLLLLIPMPLVLILSFISYLYEWKLQHRQSHE